MRSALLTLLTVSALSAQQTPALILPSFGSQLNTLESCLIASAVATAPTMLPSNFSPVLFFNTPSRTFAHTTDGTLTGVAPGNLDLFLTFEGAPNTPFILAASVDFNSLPCGGPAGTPCMTAPSLFSSIPTNFGTYHLDANPILVFDGILGTAPPGVTGPFGTQALSAAIPIDTVANGGLEQRFALQLLFADATHPFGFRLSAALNVDQWVQN